MKQFFSDINGIWRRFKRLVPKMLKLGDLLGEVVQEGAELAADTASAVGAFLGRVGGVSVLVGLTSPPTGGWGIAFLASSTLASWAPVLMCPLLGVLLRGIATSFRHLDNEGERELQRRLDRHGEPEFERQMDEQANIRADVNERTTRRAEKAPLHEDPSLEELLADWRVLAIRGGAPEDLGLILLRVRKSRLAGAVESSGPIAKEVREGLLGSWEGGGAHVDDDLRGALAPLGYQLVAVPFSAGGKRYLLAAIAEATIPPIMRLQVSRMATELVDRHAEGESESKTNKKG